MGMILKIVQLIALYWQTLEASGTHGNRENTNYTNIASGLFCQRAAPKYPFHKLHKMVSI